MLGMLVAGDIGSAGRLLASWVGVSGRSLMAAKCMRHWSILGLWW